MSILPIHPALGRGISIIRRTDPDLPEVGRISAQRGGNVIDVIFNKNTDKLYHVNWCKDGGAWNSQANPKQNDIVRILWELFSQ